MGAIKLYSGKSSVADLLTNGIGILEAVSAPIFEEINGEFSISVTVPAKSRHAESIQYGAVVSAMTPRGLDYFILDIPTVTLDTVTVKGYQISIALGNPRVINAWIDAKTGSQALAIILASAPEETRFSGTSDIALVNNMRIAQQSPLAALLNTSADNCFANRWGGEAERNKFTFNMLSRLGADRGYKIALGKNLTGVSVSMTEDGYTNRIIPKCLSANDTDLFLPEVYIDSARANPYDNMVHAQIVKCEGIKVGQTDAETGLIPYPDEASAFAAMRAKVAALYADGADSPKTTVDITFVNLGDTKEYAEVKNLLSLNLQLGDTIHADYGYGFTDLRVVSCEYDPLTERFNKITLGNKQPNLATSLYASDVDLSALKSEVTQTVKQGENYNNVYINHSDGFVAENDTLGVKWKANATQTGFYKIVDDSFLGGAAVINSIVTMVAGAMTNDIASGYYAKTGTILDGGSTRYGIGFYNGPTLKWFLCQYEVGAFHSIALYDENLIPRISLDADGACYIRDAAGRKRQCISASGDFSVWDAADKERMRISASGEFLVWDAAGHLRQWIKGDNSILYSPNGANLMYVNDTNVYKNIGGVVSIL